MCVSNTETTQYLHVPIPSVRLLYCALNAEDTSEISFDKSISFAPNVIVAGFIPQMTGEYSKSFNVRKLRTLRPSETFS